MLQKGEPMDDLISRQQAIDTEGLDEEIRCEMCRNPMRTNRGCDGNCKYDEKLYERIKPLPSAQPEIIHCGECTKMEVDSVFHDCWCGETGKKVWVNHYCGYAERKEVTT